MNNAAYLDMIGKKARGDTEERMQQTLVEYLRWGADKRIWFWHTPNGGQRSKASAGKLKALGTRRGVPDLQFLFPDGTVAFLELKAIGGKLSVEQGEFLVHCDEIGVMASVAYGFDQAIDILRAWRVLPQET